MSSSAPGLTRLEQIIDDAVGLALVPAPTFREGPRLDWLEERLAGAPGRRYRDSAGSVIWMLGEGRPEVLVTAHVDTVFSDGVPLEVQRLGGLLVGPGIGDNAVAIATVVGVAEELVKCSFTAPWAVAFTVGEEGLGNLRGSATACDELRPRHVIAVEGHGLDRIFVDAVGSVRARIVVGGPGGHSWVDRGMPSAVHALLAVTAELLRDSSADAPVNIGVVSGGESVNAIAAEATALVELRSLEERRLEEFSSSLTELVLEPPLELRVDESGRRPAGSLPRDSTLLGVVCAVRAQLGLPVSLDAASTDANAALVRGIPALALGVARGGGMHTIDEHIEIDSIPIGYRQLAEILTVLLVPDR